MSSARLLLGMLVGLLAGFTVGGQALADAASFVRTDGTRFVLAGQPYFVTGVNNHYLTVGSEQEVLGVLDDAVAMGANVVRTYLHPVIGSLDGSVATIWDFKSTAEVSNLGVHGNYLLFWDPVGNRMAINTGANGMQKVDFLIAQARARNLKLVIAFLDFWAYTGGAQQMRAWYGSRDEYSFFFTDPRTKQDYRDWVRFVLERVNPLTGVAYKDDPTIFAWELMNEPYAKPDRLRDAWIAEMSYYVKTLDRNHLVSSGHANVYNKLSDLSIPSIDFGTWHGYPLYYKLTPKQFNALIGEFCALGRKHDKPVLLEEFGYARSNPDQVSAYKQWLDTLQADPNCAGWMVWRLVSRQDSGLYPIDEHDQFDIHNDGSPIWNLLKDAAARGKQKYE